jgi:hypothetical protein
MGQDSIQARGTLGMDVGQFAAHVLEHEKLVILVQPLWRLAFSGGRGVVVDEFDSGAVRR